MIDLPGVTIAYLLGLRALPLRCGRWCYSSPQAVVTRHLAAAFFATMALALAPTHAQVVEAFDYPTGELSGRNGGVGWSGAWRNQSSQNGGGWTVSKQGLHHAALAENLGRSVRSAGHGSRYQRKLAKPYSTGLAYLSFLSRSSNRTADPYSALELQLLGDGEAFRVFQLGLLRNDDGNPAGGAENELYARSRASAGGGGGDTALLVKFNTDVNLFVVRFDLDADMASVFVNPDENSDYAGSGDGDLTLFPGFSFDRVSIANFAGDNEFVIDEIRIANTPPALAVTPEVDLVIDRNNGIATQSQRDRH